MTSQLNSIIGMTLRAAAKVHDYVQLYFTDGAVLNIYNPFSLEASNPVDLADLAGSSVRMVSETPEKAVIEFDNGVQILIDLRDEAYIGPEAMQLNVPGKPGVVWN